MKCGVGCLTRFATFEEENRRLLSFFSSLTFLGNLKLVHFNKREMNPLIMAPCLPMTCTPSCFAGQPRLCLQKQSMLVRLVMQQVGSVPLHHFKYRPPVKIHHHTWNPYVSLCSKTVNLSHSHAPMVTLRHDAVQAVPTRKTRLWGRGTPGTSTLRRPSFCTGIWVNQRGGNISCIHRATQVGNPTRHGICYACIVTVCSYSALCGHSYTLL